MFDERPSSVFEYVVVLVAMVVPVEVVIVVEGRWLLLGSKLKDVGS